jgi:phosphoribosyl 1,2-cyclic phosphate phosphodiesterase
MRVKILGCGYSIGVPVVACNCKVCTSSEEKNKRSRCSLMLEGEGKNLLVDFGPDIRHQMLREEVEKIDAAILTHAHADHMHGIDDLKVFAYNSGVPLDIYSDADTLGELEHRFSYMFQNWQINNKQAPPRLVTKQIPLENKADIEGFELEFFTLDHGFINSLGFRLKDFAYVNDVKRIPEAAEKYLYNLDTMILDCVDYQDTRAHSGLATALGWIEKFAPQKVYLTNMGHNLDYYHLKSQLPAGVEPAFDGMKIDI